nr:DUF4255 domain-containing protein [uncultured Mucilaginibacter sp.]
MNLKLGSTTDPRLVLGNIAKAVDGDSASNPLNNRIILSLINIEEDKVSKIRENYTKTSTGIIYKNPPILVNLYILIAANYSTYADNLKMMTFVIQFFQSQNSFTPTGYPGLDPKIIQLNADLFTLNFEQINHIWSTLGGKYLPSAMYKIRQITVEDENAAVTDGRFIEEIVTNTIKIN